MAQELPLADDPPPVPRRRIPWISLSILALLLLVAASIWGALRWIDSPAGHRFVAAQIAGLRPASGLRIEIGGIEGSLFKRLRVTDVRFSDPQGRFARIAAAQLQWYPLAWASNRLDIDWLHVEAAELARLPRLKSTGARKSLLPDFDIRVMDLRVDRLTLGPALAGKAHALRADGRVDIRKGRAILDLRAAALDAGDRLHLALDSRPDDNRFDMDADGSFPADGILAGLSGLHEPVALNISGEGVWSQWHGRIDLRRGGAPAVDLALDAKAGHYRLQGPVTLFGPLAALGGGTAALEAAFTFENRLVEGTASLTRDGVALEAEGGVDLARARFDDLRLALHVDRPAAVSRALAGRPVDLKARLTGPFDDAALELLLTAPELRQGGIALTGLRLESEGRLAGRAGWRFKLSASALRTGQPTIDARLRGLSASGMVRLAPGRLILDPTDIRASGLNLRAMGEAATGGGALDLRLTGGMKALELAGLGQLDLAADLRLSRVPRGRLSFGGRVEAAMNRLDNGFLRTIAGGLPTLAGRIGLGGDGALQLDDLMLTAPALMLEGDATRARDGSVHIIARGDHGDYGPLSLILDGNIAKPHVDLTLDRPGQGLRLAGVHAVLVPDEAGYAVDASGQSMLGPFTAQGAILLPPGGTSQIDIAAIRLGDVLARGQLVPGTGGVNGRLVLSGPADGSIDFSVAQDVQQLALDVDLGSVRFAGPLGLSVNRGQVTARMTLRRHAVGIDGEIQARGVRYGSLRIGRFSGKAALVNGAGTVDLAMSAQNGRAYDLTAKADVTPEQMSVTLGGTLDRQPMRFAGPAVVRRIGDAWQLDSTTLIFRGGRVTLAGLLGTDASHVEARLHRLPLSVLDLADSDLGLGGTADGSLVYDLPRGGVPSGKLSLRVHGLTRSGLALSSAPIDIGVNAALDDRRAAVRAVIADGGTVIGRAQALLAPLGTGPLMTRLNAAPLQAQIAYNGSADTLWRLTNIELLSLGGRVAISAQAGGTLADPRIAGTVTARDASLQSPATGMALSHITASGRFDGAQLRLDDVKGETAGGGTVAGTAHFTFSGERGIGIDVALQANRAVLLDRDDVGATVTGPLTIRSDGGAGTIGGELDVVASRFMLGRAAAVAEIPVIRLIEINRSGDDPAPTRAAEPWRLDIKAKAARGLKVDGLGMQSEWAADLAITGPVTAPVFLGSATLIEGSYDFAGKRFDLREGRLTFNGATPVNPALDIRAVADVSDLNATISVTGTSLRPIVAMSSIPAMPQDELLSRLLFGTSITNLSAPEALQLASAVAAFQSNGGGLDPINAVRKATGLSRLRILAADATTGQKTAIAAGKNIGRLYVELISDGQGYSATSVEYRITRWLSLLSSVSSIGRQKLSARVSKDY